MQIPDDLLFRYLSLEIANDNIFLMLEMLRHRKLQYEKLLKREA